MRPERDKKESERSRLPFEVVAEGDEPRRRWWIWAVYVVLFAASVPWYMPGGSSPTIWLGLPDWVMVSLVASVGIASFTIYVVVKFWTEPVSRIEGSSEVES